MNRLFKEKKANRVNTNLKSKQTNINIEEKLGK
jgi:hypothetical protein